MGIVANSIILTFSLLILSQVQARSFSQHESNITFEAPPKDVALEGRVSISRVNINAGEQQLKQHCSAVIQTGGKKYYGAEGFLSINKPQVYMPGQWSSSRIKLSNGAESVEAGWMVNPDVFKDNETHLYAKFAGAKSGCINTDCPGFVHVGEKVNLGRLPEHYGQRYYWNISIDKHQDDDNWWLSISPSKYQIGYWPKNLFTSLADAASQIEWGGEINNPGPSYPPPDMGNGRKVVYDGKLSAYIGHLTLIDESFNAINPRDTVKYQDCESLYVVLDFGYKGETFGHFIVFGGGNPTDA